MMSRDRLKLQVRQQFLARDKFVSLRDITIMSHWRLRNAMIEKQVDDAINVFSV